MSIEEIRLFLDNWAAVILALCGLVAAWPVAFRQLKRWSRELNLFHRVRMVEIEVDELTSVAHSHEEGTP